MADLANYGFVGRRPDAPPPELGQEQVRQLCAYIEALATVRAQQLADLGLTDLVAPYHSPEGIREHARFLRNLYRPKVPRTNSEQRSGA